MDVQAIIGIGGGIVGIAATAYGIGRRQVSASLNDKVLEPVRKDIGAVDHRVRGIQQWREGLPAHLEAKFVQRVELDGIKDSLDRIERNQEALTKRFMDGAV